MPRILLAEDDEIMRITVQDRLERQNWEVEAVENGREALERIRGANYHIVISDIKMPELDGMELLETVRQEAAFTDVIMMTAYGSVDDAINCLKKGATDYILKPFDMDDLIIRINRILENQQMRARCASLEENDRTKAQRLIGNSSRIKEIFQLIERVAPTDTTVLITGESGTGKELAANAIHRASPRNKQPYIRINCAAIPEGLMESELFGHEKGAFTGAVKKKPGKFEMADSGTLLLDEIGEMPLPLQVKLLRVLQENELERLGGTRMIKIDVRIICSTSRKLEEEVAAGRFRQDLLYRLQVIPIVMPPLRDRKSDIATLATHFLKEYSMKRGVALTLSAEALQCLLHYSFPGNVRELRNIIERASVLAPEPMIIPHDLPVELRGDRNDHPLADPGSESLILSDVLSTVEKETICKALQRSSGNRIGAAQHLGISRKSLWQKMKQYGIEL